MIGDDKYALLNVSGVSMMRQRPASGNHAVLWNDPARRCRFRQPAGYAASDKAVSGTVYKLNASYQALQEDPPRYGIYYVAELEATMRGLERGAPSRVPAGIRIGRVERILIKELVTQRRAGGRQTHSGALLPGTRRVRPEDSGTIG